MKHFLSIVFLAVSAGLVAQSSIRVYHQKTTNTVTPGSTIYTVTQSSQVTKMTFDVENMSTASHTYHVTRTDVFLHPSSVDTAKANFCFAGLCYDNTTTLSVIALELGGGERSNVKYTDTMFYSLDADIKEASTVGMSIVQYKIYEENNPSDNFVFTIVYNNGVGIVEESARLSGLRFFPNPAKESCNLLINASKNSSGTLTIYNTIGAQVLSRNLQLEEGKNNISLDLQQLSKGIYIAQIKNGAETLSKKLIVE